METLSLASRPEPLKIRPFQAADLEAVLAIQNQNPTSARWRAEDYRRIAGDPQGLLLIAANEAPREIGILGFAVFRHAMGEAELLNIAAARERQRCGVGTALLLEGLRRLAEMGAQRVFLEVRASNQAAVAFYGRAGFVRNARRPDYYRHPTEDALILVRELSRAGGEGPPEGKL